METSTGRIIMAMIVGAALMIGGLTAGCTRSPEPVQIYPGGSEYQNYEQKFVGSGMCNDAAPEWVKGTMPREPEMLFFVGRGMAYNILDEKAAYDDARDHAMEQIGRYILTRVNTTVVDVDKRYFETPYGLLGQPPIPRGGRFIPGEKPNQKYNQQTVVCTESLLGDIEERQVYWEQWEVKEVPERRNPEALRMRRYKCWLLVAVPREKLEARIDLTLKVMRLPTTKSNLPQPAEQTYRETLRNIKPHPPAAASPVPASVTTPTAPTPSPAPQEQPSSPPSTTTSPTKTVPPSVPSRVDNTQEVRQIQLTIKRIRTGHELPPEPIVADGSRQR